MVSHWQAGLYIAAVLLPLAAFLVEFIGIRILKRLNAYIATGAIGLACVLSLIGFCNYFVAAHVGSPSGLFAEAEHPVAQEGPEQVLTGQPAPGQGAEASHEAKPHEVLVWSASTPWISLGARSTGVDAVPPLTIPLAVHVDNLTVIMFLMVTFIATLIHVYSMGYMHDDPRYPRFFAYLSLFCFSMLGLVASANIFMVFLFWELVGVCSYLLIGFWYEDKKNCDAANKAFIVNRVGDVGMLMGLGLLWTYLGTFEIEEINHSIRDHAGKLHVATATAEAGGAEEEVVQMVDRETGKVKVDEVTDRPLQIPMWALALAGLGVFAGCVGKSAQFPLHVWLPDAMAGPTPVSALIHAATMVAAGVYLVGRFFPLFTDEVLLYIAYTGGITLFIAATIAVVQTDYKKVLAYSTVSQLGFMMLGLGVGGWAAGLFHLLTHAFFKALLFLGGGERLSQRSLSYGRCRCSAVSGRRCGSPRSRRGSERSRSRAYRSSAGSTPRTRSWLRQSSACSRRPAGWCTSCSSCSRRSARRSRRFTCSGCGCSCLRASPAAIRPSRTRTTTSTATTPTRTPQRTATTTTAMPLQPPPTATMSTTATRMTTPTKARR